MTPELDHAMAWWLNHPGSIAAIYLLIVVLETLVKRFLRSL